jgi:hypothetical protein
MSNTIFGRRTESGDVRVFHNPDGEVVTKMSDIFEAQGFSSETKIHPMESSGSYDWVSLDYPDGIILSTYDAVYLRIEMEDE